MTRTVAIIACAHHGTTMVAGVCELLGVPMVGKNYDPKKWEDTEMVQAQQGEEQFAAIIARRNAEHDVWGFKSPGAWLRAPWMGEYLRNPVYLAIYKDPVSVAFRRFKSISASKVENTIRQMEWSIRGMRERGFPAHCLSYQRAIVAPAEFVQQVAGLIGIAVDEGSYAQAVAYIQPNTAGNKGAYPPVPLR